jgi:hypothetical protein
VVIDFKVKRKEGVEMEKVKEIVIFCSGNDYGYVSNLLRKYPNIKVRQNTRKQNKGRSAWKGTEREKENYLLSRITAQGGLPSLGKRRP